MNVRKLGTELAWKKLEDGLWVASVCKTASEFICVVRGGLGAYEASVSGLNADSETYSIGVERNLGDAKLACEEYAKQL